MTADKDEPPQEAETVVEGDAIELPSEPAADGPQSPVAASAPPVYESEPYAARAYASRTDASASGPVASGPGWPGPGIDLAERPEYLVGAAFGGGLLLALILRKLGH